jgi:hypothetical protein
LALTSALSHPKRTGEGGRAATQMRNNTDQKVAEKQHRSERWQVLPPYLGRLWHPGKRLAGGDRIPAGNEIWIPAGDGNPFSLRERRIPGKPNCPLTPLPLSRRCRRPPLRGKLPARTQSGAREHRPTGRDTSHGTGLVVLRSRARQVSGSSPAWDGIRNDGTGLKAPPHPRLLSRQGRGGNRPTGRDTSHGTGHVVLRSRARQVSGSSPAWDRIGMRGRD